MSIISINPVIVNTQIQSNVDDVSYSVSGDNVKQFLAILFNGQY